MFKQILKQMFPVFDVKEFTYPEQKISKYVILKYFLHDNI